MKHSLIITLSLMTTVMLMPSCNSKKTAQAEQSDTSTVKVPAFVADSAYQSIETQCAFGPRVLDTDAHEKCGQYIEAGFKASGCQVTLQRATFKRYDGLSMKGYNIIASINPKAKRRIMIASHWDSRPWADHDSDTKNQHTPVPAANDGASGIAIMLEMARVIQHNPLSIGIDFVCFDAEDAGVPEWEKNVKDDESTWCLGAQYWAAHPHSSDIAYGILLDMVGGQGAHFYQEGFSMQYASNVIDLVWSAAEQAGYGSYFPRSSGGMITDDHLPVNRIAKVPMIDIIPYYPTGDTGFGPTWHTLQDTPANIDRSTLQAVGQTLLQLLYTQQ